MKTIESIADLEELYGKPLGLSLKKVVSHITPLYKQWIEASRFVVITTVGEEGCDASPRGDQANVVKVVDPKTLWCPDWQGNNRLDSLRNIVEDGRISLMFMVPGCNNVVRVNGRAKLTVDEEVTGAFARPGNVPKTVIVITARELYFQCAKALMRSELWLSENETHRVPTAGQFIREVDGGFDSESYDTGYAEYAKSKMW
jgi:PPOX class probable FMN-dependent enzyme